MTISERNISLRILTKVGGLFNRLYWRYTEWRKSPLLDGPWIENLTFRTRPGLPYLSLSDRIRGFEILDFRPTQPISVCRISLRRKNKKSVKRRYRGIYL